MKEPSIEDRIVHGHSVVINHDLGHIAVEHQGDITWDTLQSIKNAVWGAKARAIEVYPRQEDLVRNKCIRHLWRLGESDFAPDLLGLEPQSVHAGPDPDSLLSRYRAAWIEVWKNMRRAS